MKTDINYKKYFQIALKKGFTSLELMINENQSMYISLEDNLINENVKSDICTLVITGLYKNKKSSLYLETINEDEIEDILELLKNQISVLNLKEKDTIFKGSDSYPEVKESNFNFSSINIEKKYDLLFKLEKELSNKSVFLNKIDSITYQESYFKKRLINSEGLNLEEKGSFARIYVDCVFQKNDEKEVVSQSEAVCNFCDFDILKLSKKVIDLGEKKIGGRSVESKNYPTVFSNKIFAKLLEQFSSVFSGMSAYRNLTRLKDKEGQKIASSKVTIIDDPLTSKSFFQYKFDDEGVACYSKKIIEKGVFKQFIYDLKTSLIFNTEPTGNSFSNSISMTNCYLQKGSVSFEDMISTIDEGIYIDFVMGLHAGINEVSGDFSLQAGGFKIEKGKITTPVKMIIISGNFFNILLDLKEISDDLSFHNTSSFGSPSVYAGDLVIAGNK